MNPQDPRSAIFYTPAEVAAIFRHEGDLKWLYRTADRGFLRPFVRRFGRSLYFDRAGIEKLIETGD
jgi:helix-turn-helix protein